MAWRAGWVAEDAVQQDAAVQDSASDQNSSDGGETGRRSAVNKKLLPHPTFPAGAAEGAKASALAVNAYGWQAIHQGLAEK